MASRPCVITQAIYQLLVMYSPLLTDGYVITDNGAMCAAYIRGLQGNHSTFMKIAATVKRQFTGNQPLRLIPGDLL